MTLRRAIGGLCMAATLVSLASCSVTRRLPDDSYMLKRNEIRVDKEVPRKERITASEIDKYIRQSPNRRFLGVNLYAWIYAQANPDKNNGWNRFLRRIGEEPVVFDMEQTERSLRNIRIYMNSRGYFNSNDSVRIDTLRRKKVAAIYSVKQGEPYRISSISYDFRDKFLQNIILEDSTSSLLHVGDVFDSEVLNQERIRITDYLKNKGYYNFNVSNITYVADTSVGSRQVALSEVIHQRLTGYTNQGQPIYGDNAIYRIKDIYIYPNFNPLVDYSDPANRNRLDTLYYRGLNVVYDTKLRTRPKVLSGMVRIAPGSLYDLNAVNATYNDIMRLGYFKSASILFNEVAAPKEDNQVTYVGGNQTTEENRLSTTEGYLRCDIQCNPALLQGYKIELEGSTTASFYGLRGTIGYQNRNLFRGAEQFDISITAGFEFMKTGTRKTAFEWGGSTSLSFPRFLLPFDVDSRHRAVTPQTRIALSVNDQQRVFYDRTLSSVSWSYNWGSGRFSNFAIRPFDISLIKMGYIDKTFWERLQNPYLQNSYTSQLIAGISGSYVFNNQPRNLNAGATVVRFNWETAGNLISGLTRLFSHPVHLSDGNSYYNLFGIRFAQYVRGDLSISSRIVLGEKTALAWRLYGGAGISYGNSDALPMDRLFFAGGSNGMRGWVARTLGPGNAPEPQNRDYPTQLGNMKLEANLEFRFPIWSIFHGAVFCDLGNIWFLKQSESNHNPEEVFHFNTFYKQLGFNTGIGLRLDIKFAVLRLDWGIQLHNPNWPQGERWIHNFKWKNTALNFGVGYPF